MHKYTYTTGKAHRAFFKPLTLFITCLWCLASFAFLHGLPLWVFLGGGVDSSPAGPIAYVGTAVNNFATTRSPSVVLPTCSTNDILILTICATGTASYNGTPPAGWSFLQEGADNTSTQTSAVYWARVDGVNVTSGSTTAWTNIMAANESGIVAVSAFSGCKTSGSPINGTPPSPVAGGSATASDGPTITPTVDNCMIVSIRGIDPGDPAREFTWDAPFTARLGYATTPSGVNGVTAAIYIGTYLQETSAAISPQGDFDVAEHAVRFSYALEPQ